MRSSLLVIIIALCSQRNLSITPFRFHNAENWISVYFFLWFDSLTGFCKIWKAPQRTTFTPVYPKVRTHPALTQAKCAKHRKLKHRQLVKQLCRTRWPANELIPAWTCELPKRNDTFTIANIGSASNYWMSKTLAFRQWNYEFKKNYCFSSCLLVDPYHSACLIILIGCFVELKEFNSKGIHRHQSIVNGFVIKRNNSHFQNYSTRHTNSSICIRTRRYHGMQSVVITT